MAKFALQIGDEELLPEVKLKDVLDGDWRLNDRRLSCRSLIQQKLRMLFDHLLTRKGTL